MNLCNLYLIGGGGEYTTTANVCLPAHKTRKMKVCTECQIARVVPTSITASGIASKLVDEWGGIWTQKTHNPPERERESERKDLST
jgi:hypothetical protein